MQFKELLTDLDSNGYLEYCIRKRSTVVWRQSYFYYNGGLINEHIWSNSYSNIRYGCDNND